jgi:hypothetical protein
MQGVWFRKWGPIYLPSSLTGWLVSLVTVTMAAANFVAVDHHSHSVSDTLIGAGPVIAVLFLLLFLLAARSSQR